MKKKIILLILGIWCISGIAAQAAWEWEITDICSGVDGILCSDNSFTPYIRYYGGSSGDTEKKEYQQKYYYDGNTLVPEITEESGARTAGFVLQAPVRKLYDSYELGQINIDLENENFTAIEGSENVIYFKRAVTTNNNYRGTYHLLSPEGEDLCPDGYDFIGMSDFDGCLLIRVDSLKWDDDDYYGLMSYDGEILAAPDKKFGTIVLDSYENGIGTASRRINGKVLWGLVDRQLNTVVDFKAEWIVPIHDKDGRRLLIVTENGQTVIKDMEQNVILNRGYSTITPVENGCFEATTGNASYPSTVRRTFLNPDYEELFDITKYSCSWLYLDANEFIVKGEDGSFISNLKGEILSNTYDVIFVSGSDTVHCFQKGDQYGFIDSNYREIVPAIYDDAETKGAFCYGYYSNEGEIYTDILDDTGKKLGSVEGELNPDFPTALRNGFQYAKKDGKYAIVSNETWSAITDFILVDRCLSFKDGTMCLEADGSTWVIDRNGENIFPDKYAELYRIDSGTYVVLSGDVMQLMKRVTTALHTDVEARINGAEIPCYSVNSRCVITAEDLRGYGFDVNWEPEERRLNITRNPDYYEINPVPAKEKGESGSFYSSIADTDIRVYYNGERIQSFAIDGEMLIKPEDMEGDGISFSYSDEDRTLYMTVDGMEVYR